MLINKYDAIVHRLDPMAQKDHPYMTAAFSESYQASFPFPFAINIFCVRHHSLEAASSLLPNQFAELMPYDVYIFAGSHRSFSTLLQISRPDIELTATASHQGQ